MADQATNQTAEQPAAQISEEQAARKPMKYYIDFENVHGPGLKGVDALNEDDHVLVFYSQAAETFHIEHAIDLLHSKAKIEFIEIDGGTRNSLDFQLVAALFGTISDEYGYAIVSGDGGFDAAIKMGQRLELPEVVRVVNILGDTELPAKSRSRRSRSAKSAAKEQPAASEQSAVEQSEQNTADAEAPEQPKPARRSRRRGGSRRTAAAKADQPADGQDEAVVGQAEERAEDSSQGQAAERKDESIESSAADEVQVELPDPESENDAKAVTQSDSGQPAKRERRARRKSKGENNGDDANGAGDDDGAGNGGDDSGAGSGSQENDAADNGDASGNGAGGDSHEGADEGGNGGNADGQKGNGGSSRRRGSRGSGKSGKREDVAALLAKNGVEVDQHQLSTIMQALNGAKKRQDFYRKIIQLEKQEKGLALYREVRDYYEPMLEIVKA